MRPKRAEAAGSPIGVIFDVDGVLEVMDDIASYAPQELRKLSAAGIRIAFLTNDIRPECQGRVDEFIRRGLEIDVDRYFTPFNVLDGLLKRQHLTQPLYIGDDPPPEHIWLKAFQVNPDCIVLGDVSKQIHRLEEFVEHAATGLPIFALQKNPLHYLGGILLPDVGYHIAAWEYCAGVPITLIGKPSLLAYELVLRSVGVNPQRAFMVSDSYENDLIGAIRCGIHPILLSNSDLMREAHKDCLVIKSLQGITSLISELRETLL